MVPADLAKTGEGESMQMYAPSSVKIQAIGASFTYTPVDTVRVFTFVSDYDLKIFINDDTTNYWVLKKETEGGPYAVGMGVYQFVIVPDPSPKPFAVLTVTEMRRLVN
jgi:hypothetical protein